MSIGKKRGYEQNGEIRVVTVSDSSLSPLTRSAALKLQFECRERRRGAVCAAYNLFNRSASIHCGREKG